MPPACETYKTNAAQAGGVTLRCATKQKMTNYFNYSTAAKRYKEGRPNIHPVVVERVKAKLALTNKLKNVLDVGCGTGLSTVALLDISERVIGVDTSAAMLEQAEVQPGIQYQQLSAEEIDTLGVTFDLIMMSSVFHWLNQRVFLEACGQALRADSYIIIHNNYFTSTTKDDNSADFTAWMRERYLPKYTTPSRHNYQLNEEEIKALGFVLTDNERFENTVHWQKQDLINYLITQSNVIANVELGNYRIDEVTAWLAEELTTHFEGDEEREFVFGNRLILLKKK